MKRLVYSPKAYAFVRTDEYPAGIDISDYIVSGNVHRRVNAASTCEIELRNPKRMWTTIGKPMFHPMDAITVYLTRLKGFPVQAFTGYLDSADVVQLFPGNINITATCTLKRLLNTFWDPALPYVQNGFLAQYGWMVKPESGVLFSDQFTIDLTDSPGKQLTDGSMGALLYAVLTHVGQWDADDIFIEKLPDVIVNRMTAIYNDLASENDTVKEQIDALFTKLLSPGAQGNGSGGGAGGTDASVPDGDPVLIHVDNAKAAGAKWKVDTADILAVLSQEGGTSPTGQPVRPGDGAGPPSYAQFTYGTGASYNIKWGDSASECDCLAHYLHDLGYSTNRLRSFGAYNGGPGNPQMDYAAKVDALSKKYAGAKSKSASPTPAGASGAAPDATTKDAHVATSGSGAVDTAEDVINNIVLPIAAECGIHKTAAQNRIDNGNHTHLGSRSDHSFDPTGKVAWAADISDGVLTTNETKLVKALCERFDIPYSMPILASASHDGYRYQIIHGADFPPPTGDHRDHVHFGARADTSTGTLTAGPSAEPILNEGDSLAVGSADGLKALRSTLTTRAKEGRSSAQGVADLKSVKDLPATLIVQLGTNDSNVDNFRTNVKAVMGLKGVENVYWVNISRPPLDGTTDAEINAVLTEEAAANTKLHIIDWKAAVDNGDAKLSGDQIHPTAAGYTARAMLVSEALPAIPDAATGDGGGGDDNSKASAFGAYLSLPGLEQTAEAMGLQGQKSLMNDQPLFPFVEQLAEASLRNFMSLPNGDFYAFFPDYFGGFEHRSPYWMINDVEILDGKITLTDDALATHVYVVGDITNDDQVNFMDRLQSGGVVTMFDAFKGGFVTVPDELKAIRKKGDETRTSATKIDADGVAHGGGTIGKTEGELDHDYVIRFLQKHGARPHYEEAPMVRSPYFEAFLAYQRFQTLWAKQFASTFTFTFMPEIYPGGIVGFEGHNLQCYVDEVIHSFDYEGGFATQAVLSAPAAITPDGSGVSAGMVRAFDLIRDRTAPPKGAVPPAKGAVSPAKGSTRSVRTENK